RSREGPRRYGGMATQRPSPWHPRSPVENRCHSFGVSAFRRFGVSAFRRFDVSTFRSFPMSTFPSGRTDEFVGWCRAHDAVFAATADEIGLTKGQAADFADLSGKAQAALIAQQEAIQASRVATQEARAAIRKLQGSAAD